MNKKEQKLRDLTIVGLDKFDKRFIKYFIERDNSSWNLTYSSGDLIDWSFYTYDDDGKAHSFEVDLPCEYESDCESRYCNKGYPYDPNNLHDRFHPNHVKSHDDKII